MKLIDELKKLDGIKCGPDDIGDKSLAAYKAASES